MDPVTPRRFLHALVIFALLAPAAQLTDGSTPAGGPAPSASAADAPDRARWTFMVYLDADNNLEAAGVEDFNEMETVGSTDEVNIVVQMDRHAEYDTSNGDWTGTKRFLVVEDDDTSAIGSPEVEDLGEANMGDPRTLTDFILWSAQHYPAQNYILVLWDHGGAFRGACWDEDPGEELDSGDDEDWLSMNDLTLALGAAAGALGGRLDIVGFDACLMAQLAVLHQIRHYCDYTVASGYSEPGEGWPYENILPPLVENPQMSAEELGRVIVEEYVDSYTDREDDPQDSLAITQALFDNSRVGHLSESVDRMAMLLATRAGTKVSDPDQILTGKNTQITEARRFTNSYDLVPGYLPANVIAADPTGYALYDIIDLMDNLRMAIPLDRELHTLADEVTDAAQSAMIFSRVNKYHGNFKGAHGVSLYFPSGVETEYSGHYDDTDFARECHWDEFLSQYYDQESSRDTPPGITLESPDPLTVVRGESFTISGTAYDLQGTPSVQIRLDGGEWSDVGVSDVGDGMVRWNYLWDLTELEEGNHTVHVRAFDEDGQQSPILTREVVVEPERAGGDTGMNFVFIVGGATLGVLAAALFVKHNRDRRRKAGMD